MLTPWPNHDRTRHVVTRARCFATMHSRIRLKAGLSGFDRTDYAAGSQVRRKTNGIGLASVISRAIMKQRLIVCLGVLLAVVSVAAQKQNTRHGHGR